MKRIQKILSKKPSGEGIMGGALLVGLTIILSLALLGLVSTPALAKGNAWDFKYSRDRYHPEVCSETASAAFFACYNEKKDDFWIAQGNCYNYPKKEQADCLETAKEDFEEAKAECQDQLEARKELCEALGEAPYDPMIKPGNFLTDPQGNDYFPLVPGTKWVYKTKVGGEITETNTVEVMDYRVKIEGITCAVVHDVVYQDDIEDPTDPAQLAAAVKLEETYDWYAQDKDGNVWYFGERSLAREGCEGEAQDCDAYLLTNEGSWKTGFDEAKPGIIMYADPGNKEEGFVYRQEFALGDAEDVAEIISVGTASVEVPEGMFNNDVLNTKDYTPIEPDTFEYKYYATGVGVLLEVAYENDEPTGERTELVTFTTP